jgi:hypothetical protein
MQNRKKRVLKRAIGDHSTLLRAPKNTKGNFRRSSSGNERSDQSLQRPNQPSTKHHKKLIPSSFGADYHPFGVRKYQAVMKVSCSVNEVIRVEQRRNDVH